jgi:hypothetical protein
MNRMIRSLLGVSLALAALTSAVQASAAPSDPTRPIPWAHESRDPADPRPVEPKPVPWRPAP